MDYEMNEIEAVERMSRDLVRSARDLTPNEVRYIVDGYYIIQKYRVGSGNQICSMTKADEPVSLLSYLKSQAEVIENQVKRAMATWTDGQITGRWLKSIVGVGPVLAAGLLAHTHIEHCPTVGHLWSFAGLNPEAKWEKGQKRPWNASLKTTCWKLGESFVKVQNHEDDVYGKLYLSRRAYEEPKNDALEYADQAAMALMTKRIRPTTDAYGWYNQGKLPPAQLYARAKRHAVKIFLAHYHHVVFYNAYGEHPPKPYVLSQLGHAHEIQVPNWDYFMEMHEAGQAAA